MPILPSEPDLFPDDLFEQLRAPTEALAQPPRQWWAAYTLSRREKDLLRRLRGLKVFHYGPMIRKRFRSPSGRVRESFVPLFANYVFIHGTDEERRQALTTNCISHTVEVPDSARLTRDLQQIRRLIVSDAPLLPESKLEKGDPVRVRSGPFAGLEGVVIKRRGEERLLVAVEFLQRGASLLLEDFQVERL